SRAADRRHAPRCGVLGRPNTVPVLTLPASLPRATCRVSSTVTTSWTGPQGAQRLDGGAAEQGEVADSDDLHAEADPVLRVLERADRGCDDDACLTAGVEDVTDQLAVSRRPARALELPA